ncbi:MAG: sialidase family protein [Nibricoccus sp.]
MSVRSCGSTTPRTRGFSRATLALSFAAVAAFIPASTQAAYTQISRLFDGGTNGGNSNGLTYHSYRIPSIVRAGGTTLIAFAEGRRLSNSDWGETNLVYKRSLDNGVTWTQLEVIEDVGLGVWGNPTAVWEPAWTGGPANGRVHLFFNGHSDAETSMSTIAPGDRKTYYTYSDNNGAPGSWAPKQDLTATLKPSAMAWDAVGPGVGIFMASNNMLIIPATERNFYSTNHGTTWNYASLPAPNAANYPIEARTGESTIVECLNGVIRRNDRVIGSVWDDGAANYRRWCVDGIISSGVPTFPTSPIRQDNLYCPSAEASILRYNLSQPDRIIFLNSDASGVSKTRCRMKVRISYDDGLTWSRDRWLYVGTAAGQFATIEDAKAAGKGGYSSMAKSSDNHVVALCESNDDPGDPNDDTDHLSIDFHKFNLPWILDGETDGP